MSINNRYFNKDGIRIKDIDLEMYLDLVNWIFNILFNGNRLSTYFYGLVWCFTVFSPISFTLA